MDNQGVIYDRVRDSHICPDCGQKQSMISLELPAHIEKYDCIPCANERYKQKELEKFNHQSEVYN